MAFHLVDILECNPTVSHPYRTLLVLCKKKWWERSMMMIEAEAGELQFGVGRDLLDAGDLGVGLGSDDGPRYWGNGQGRLELCKWLAIALHLAGRPVKFARNQIPTQSSQVQDPSSSSEKQDPIEFLANFNISLSHLYHLSSTHIALHPLAPILQGRRH
ncbi:hypothetical protein K435DRAFT_861193 [Dendrothele bispora CBS 962.96]|uniref:Uncharacterized protein n=1 Tax=Dendrothele bispora (strain CBS 962.96) TaxID=1314807 RepID=A0A4S8LVQ8_DENBC|nr:hypothetical protein K435DRAFT_861193 [Dendrothele bispora CBS 962.96]